MTQISMSSTLVRLLLLSWTVVGALPLRSTVIHPPLMPTTIAASSTAAGRDGGSSVNGRACCIFCAATAAAEETLLFSSSSSSNDGKGGDGAAQAALKFYKQYISPLLPPGCRFIPTCSEYASLAFDRYSAPQAVVLTAWRLVRCNPLHLDGYGRGVDEPTWPPPAYWAGDGRLRTFLDDELSKRRANGEDVGPIAPFGGQVDPLGLMSEEQEADDEAVLDDAEEKGPGGA